MYQTRGFIIRSTNTAEADRTIFVFTEALGLLVVNARAARKVSSKLRYSLQNYSFIRLAVVRGKNVWRLTDAENLVSFRTAGDAKTLKILAGIFSLLNRFVHGEGENPTLFRSLDYLFRFLQETELSDDEMFTVEMLAAVQIFSALGYVGESKTLAPFLTTTISKSVVENFAPHRAEALKEINRALKESHM